MAAINLTAHFIHLCLRIKREPFIYIGFRINGRIACEWVETLERKYIHTDFEDDLENLIADVIVGFTFDAQKMPNMIYRINAPFDLDYEITIFFFVDSWVVYYSMTVALFAMYISLKIFLCVRTKVYERTKKSSLYIYNIPSRALDPFTTYQYTVQSREQAIFCCCPQEAMPIMQSTFSHTLCIVINSLSFSQVLNDLFLRVEYIVPSIHVIEG